MEKSPGFLVIALLTSALLLTGACDMRRTEEEAYAPRRGFEQATKPRSGFEEERESPPRFEKEETVAPGNGEAYVPRPGFEEKYVTRPGFEETFVARPGFEVEEVAVPGFEDTDVDQPSFDEEFELRPGFEEARLRPEMEGTAPPRVVAELPGVGVNLTLNEKGLEGKVVLHGTVSVIENQRLAIRDVKTRDVLTFHPRLPVSVFRAKLTDRESLDAFAYRQVTPVGISEGISLGKRGRLVYLSERILFRSLFTAAQRDNFQVTQVTDSLREPVFTGPCRLTYEVPVRISRDDQRVELSSGESGEMTVGGIRYGINVLVSLYNAERKCPHSFDESVRQIEYLIWRK